MSNRYETVKRVTLIGAIVHVILALAKVLIGIIGKSHALLADGVHSFADLLTDGLVFLAAKYGAARADEDHPYGHARIETAASLGLALFLVLVGLGIIYDAGDHLWGHQKPAVPSWLTLWVALFSVILNEVIFRYMRAEGRRIQSDLLISNALHSRSDAAASLVVLVGIGGSLLGFTHLDALAAVIVGFLIIKMGGQIAWSNLSELVDTGLDKETIARIHKTVFQVPGVKALHELRTRRMAGRALIDLHIIVNPAVTVSEGHHISERVIELLKKEIDVIDDIVVHIDAENDEAYSSTSQLPLREELLPQLKQAWQALPGFNGQSLVRLHYLAGHIRIEVELPHTLLQTGINPQPLTEQYQQAVARLTYVQQVKLLFV